MSTIRATRFGKRNGGVPYNASGVVAVAPRRFVFVDNHEPAALFEFVLDDEAAVERITRRPLVGLDPHRVRDLEGLASVHDDDRIVLLATSSLGMSPDRSCDGLLRVHYAPDGELRAEELIGFRAWLVANVPGLSVAAGRPPDDGGLNIEGVTWDSRDGAILLGLRGPARRGALTMLRIAVDAVGAPWTTDSLGPPKVIHVRTAKPSAHEGIRDLSYDGSTGELFIVTGRSVSGDDVPFQLCTWDGRDGGVTLLDVTFHRSMKPEGVTTFRAGRREKVLIVDDNGGFAVFDRPRVR